MSAFKIVVVLGLIAVAYHFWDKHQEKRELAANTNSNGFVSMPAPTNLDTDTVIILAAENCPKEDARRADQLAEDLGRRKVPYTRAHSANLSIPEPTPALLKRIDKVMNGPLPVVFVRGRAKSNPTLDEVLAEYQTSQRQPHGMNRQAGGNRR
ncbi:MAG: hypothetical protein ABI771_11110 [Betaproteobacteria bacterium]